LPAQAKQATSPQMALVVETPLIPELEVVAHHYTTEVATHHYGELSQRELEEIPLALFTPLAPFESLEAGQAHKATVQEVSGTLFYPTRLESQNQAKAEEVPFFHFLSAPQIVDGQTTSKLSPSFCDTPTVFGVEIPTSKGSHWYGGGEQARSLCLNNTHFITWNTDAFAYTQATPSLYQSHPFLMLLQEDGSAHGIIANSTYPLHFEMTETYLKIMSHSNPPIPFSIFLFEGANPQEITSKLATMTGFMPMPPKWSLGYHQCRWSYYPDNIAKDIAQNFRKNSIPCDVIWFDIHYMDGYRIFTFDGKTFPDPKKLNDDLHELGFNTVWMIDPGVKKEQGYSVHDQCIEKGFAVVTKKDSTEKDVDRDFVGGVWPGPCVFPDFTMEETRTWWGGLYKDFMANGIDGVWNDMNEPACFNDTKTMAIDAWHRGYGGGHHSKFHNVYGMLMIKASAEGIMKAQPEKRPFVLSRANFLGGQRYGACWTGDNVSNWNHLGLSIPMALNMGLSGQPFVGPDIGGFAEEATPELFSRWIGLGALLPFSRGHTHEDTVAHEPWSFGEETTHVCRVAINRRYRLLRYFYTYFQIAAKTGLPVARPLFYADPRDPLLRTESYSFMIGEDVLVCPDVMKVRSTVHEPYLPKNHTWHPLKLDEEQHKDLPALFVRGGGIVTLQDVEQYVGEKPESLQLVIALDTNGNATGQYYNDAGNGYDYLKGHSLQMSFNARLNGKEFSLDMTSEGSYPLPECSIPVHIIHGDKCYERTIPKLEASLKTIHFEL